MTDDFGGGFSEPDFLECVSRAQFVWAASGPAILIGGRVIGVDCPPAMALALVKALETYVPHKQTYAFEAGKQVFESDSQKESRA
jgi:hypothetical protein